MILAAWMRLIGWILPAGRSEWVQAMAAEVSGMTGRLERVRLAIGCLWAALTLRERFHRRPLESSGIPVFGIACAFGATAIGLAYLKLAGAPSGILAINGAAFGMGLVAIAAMHRIGNASVTAMACWPWVGAILTLAAVVLGREVDGATRWVAVSGLFIQTSLLAVPAAVVAFARQTTPLSAAAMIGIAIGLALQPDRAMAGALLAGLTATAWRRGGPLTWVPLGAAGVSFASTLLQPDKLPAVPFVDGILWTSFGIHTAMGAALWLGCATLVAPALLGWRQHGMLSPATASFSATWAAIIAAAAIGAYPTPVVGYGSSAIIGYLASLPLLAAGKPQPGKAAGRAASATEDTENGMPLKPGGIESNWLEAAIRPLP
ncbi:MAG: hypothetical protein JNL98_19680 [Bryobacterales bacterium]|nr:hypothetical protein [Bryobacterales bacterium]